VTNNHCRELLHSGISELGLNLDPAAQQKLLDYLDLLVKWNRTYNLTAIREQDKMVTQHLLDSLAVLPHLHMTSVQTDSVADVGSGAGLPGIPLAIARSQLEVTLVESSQKKASFLQQAKIELGLNNVSVHCVRVVDFKPVKLFQTVITRAFSSLADFVSQSAHLLAVGGRLLAMKGVYPEHEINGLPPQWHVSESIHLSVPQLSAERNLIVIEKT